MAPQSSTASSSLSVAVIGLGYFSQFHLDAWTSNTGAKLIAVCDPNKTALKAASEKYDVPGFDNAADLLSAVDPDIVDIVAPPEAHAALVRMSLKKNRLLVCQKPFCSTLAVAETVAADVEAADTKLVIHENFRFQPWYRTLKALLDTGELGALYHCRFDLRPGDGRGKDAYLARQPTFQNMEQFLVRETGVHFIDLFRWLFGDISAVYAELRQLNPVIKGEDAGTLIFNHTNGMVSVFDGNRLSDHAADNHRLTMGELVLSAERSSIRLDGYGRLWRRDFQTDQETEIPLIQPADLSSFGGGCVQALIQHVIAGGLGLGTLENDINSYLPIMHITDACYESNRLGKKIYLKKSA